MTVAAPGEERVALRLRHPKPGAIMMCLLALALGVGLAAPQLLPVLDYGSYSHRRSAPTEEGYRAYVGSALRPVELVGLVYPGGVGLPHRFSTAQQRLSEYWPAVVKQGANFAEAAFALGPLLLALTVLGRPFVVGRGRSAAMVGLALIALLLALGTPLNRLLYFYFPGWSATGSPGRVGFLIVLAFCVLAGLGVREEFFADGRRVRRALIVALGACALVLALLGSVLPALAAEGAPAQDREAVQGYVMATVRANLPFMLLATLLVPGVFWAWRRNARLGAGALFAATMLVPLLLHGGLVRTGKPLPPVTVSGGGRIAVINDSWGLLQPVKALLPPNTAILGRIHELGGYDSLLHRETVKLLHDVNGQDPAPPANGNIMFIKPSADPANLAALGVTEVWSLRPLAGFGESVPGGSYLRYPLRGPGRLSVTGGVGEILEDGYDRQRIRTDGQGGLVVRDRNLPGWHAQVDGAAVPTAEGSVWREVGLPPGPHRVDFRYIP